jgi:hypothetical protein
MAERRLSKIGDFALILTHAERLTVALLFFIAFGLLRAAPPPGYYDWAQGKSGQSLRQALHERIKNHTVILYDSNSNVYTVDALKVLDQHEQCDPHLLWMVSREDELRCYSRITR